MANEKIPIDTIVNVFDPDIVWYSLEKYRGYEYSNTGIMRSLKFWKSYPFGIQIKPDKNLCFELSNELNQREKVYYKDLKLTGTPHPTRYIDPYSRNPLCTSRSKAVMERKKKLKELDGKIIPHFTTIG